MSRKSLYLLLLLVVCVATSANRIGAQADSTARAKVDALTERVARAEGAIQAQTQQLEVERKTADRAIETVTTIITWGSVFVAALAGLLGFFGYRDLRGRVDAWVEQRVEVATNEKLSTLVSDRMSAYEAAWDKRFADLVERAERLTK